MKVELLKNLCRIIGGNPAPKEFPLIEDGIRFIKMKDLGRYHLTNNLVEIENTIEPNDKFKLIKKGSILLPRSGSVGLNHRAILGRDSYMVSHICALEVLDENLLFNGFLYYYLTTVDMKRFLKKTTGLDAITFESLGKIKIPLPPLPEQKRIAKILDKADALRQKNKQLLSTYDELLKATFLEMFGDPVTNPKGWERKKLGEKIQMIQIGPFGSQLHKSDYLESGIPLINPTNIKNNRIEFDKVMTISEEKYLSLPQYHLYQGDIVMARRGDLSKVALVKQTDLKLFCGTGSLFVRFKSDVNKIFISYLLAHDSTTKYLENEAVGVTMPNLNKGIIKNIPLFAPPLTLQNQFAQIVENIEAQKALVKQSLQQSEDLFKGLVQKAFNGHL